MIKHTLLTAIITLTITSASASELICSIVGEPNASTLKITYTEEGASLLSLKSPGSDVYRTLDLQIELVNQQETSESFSAKPKLKNPIDWKKELNCFKEIGTQWYFVFDYAREIYGVYLTPYFEQKNPTCYTPRFRPQPKPLNCSLND